MLKVNEEAILNDYESLKAKKLANVSQIEADAKAYAEAHGFDETQAKEFVAFVVKLQNNGLTKAESNLLDIFNLYVDEVEEPVAETPTPISTPETIIY